MSGDTIPIAAGTRSEDDRETVLASYAETIDRLATRLAGESHNIAVGTAIKYAHGLFSAAVRKALNEAHARVRVSRGLPEHDESHRGASSDLAEEVLRHHGGGEIDDRSVQDLLVGLIHYCGPEDFDAALEGALERYEEEAEEDEAGEQAAGEEDTATALAAEEKRVEQAQITRLEVYQPAGYDA
jgi:hypothetical protein